MSKEVFIKVPCFCITDNKRLLQFQSAYRLVQDTGQELAYTQGKAGLSKVFAFPELKTNVSGDCDQPLKFLKQQYLAVLPVHGLKPVQYFERPV